jgi:methylated-DNA-[protein]-cysteine S-methyltransferase
MNETEISIELSSLGASALHLCWNKEGALTQIELNASSFSKTRQIPAQQKLALGLPPYLVELKVAFLKYFETGEPLAEPRWEFLDQSSWTEFQKKVYRAITLIPPGETRTYGWVARKIGSIGATRAVGQALKRNPVPLLVPCHRVVAHQSLGGFMGTSDPNLPEMKLKNSLLNLEEKYLNPSFSFGGFLGAVA